MKTVLKVTSEKIEYLDEDGELKYIDFELCYQNFLIARQANESFSELSEEIRKTWKPIGQRDFSAIPPYIEFYTQPMIRFEFPSVNEGFHQLRRQIEKAGWRTRDLA